eukprot:1155333-Pelagomonas_calceolata.AAC.6
MLSGSCSSSRHGRPAHVQIVRGREQHREKCGEEALQAALVGKVGWERQSLIWEEDVGEESILDFTNASEKGGLAVKTNEQGGQRYLGGYKKAGT